MSNSRVPEGGSFRLQVRSTARDQWVIVGPFPAPLAAKRLAEDLMATGLLRSVKVEHRSARGGWRTAWSWLASACLGLMLFTGCATQVGGVQAAQYQHPESGEVKRCFDNPTNRVIMGALVSWPAFAPGEYDWCKSQLEQAGYVRVPVDAEIQAELDRAYAARAESIRKK